MFWKAKTRGRFKRPNIYMKQSLVNDWQWRPQTKIQPPKWIPKQSKKIKEELDTNTKQRDLVRARKIQYQRQDIDSIISRTLYETLSKAFSHSSHYLTYNWTKECPKIIFKIETNTCEQNRKQQMALV